MFKFRIIVSFVIINIVFFASCNLETKDDKQNESTKHSTTDIKKETNPLVLKVNEQNKKNVVGDNLTISVKESKVTEKDTITLLINDEEITKLTINNSDYKWNTKNTKVGINIIEIEINKNNNHFRKTKNIILLSDITPEEYTYKIKNVYKHDVKAYTQGLFYKDGFLYEATGLKGQSTIRKVKLETGEVIHGFAIPKDIFGEGIVLFNNNIIQISWQAGKGFVYDFDTFELVDEFSFNGEGWGICTDGKKLFMTNGSAEIKVLETQSYSPIKTLQAYDDEGAVVYLNELEYINGYIYANIYQYEKIAKIDPTNGKVLAYIDLTGILPMNDYVASTDVLNGIAYDEKTKRIFVTGKKWPKLFEIDLLKK